MGKFFREDWEDWEAKDANDYEKSDVKAFVNKWFEIVKELENKPLHDKEQECEEREFHKSVRDFFVNVERLSRTGHCTKRNILENMKNEEKDEYEEEKEI